MIISASIFKLKPTKPNNDKMTTIKFRRYLIDSMQEGLASVSDAHFSRLARAVAYLNRRMERGAA
jgi:hypothetical protein